MGTLPVLGSPVINPGTQVNVGTQAKPESKGSQIQDLDGAAVPDDVLRVAQEAIVPVRPEGATAVVPVVLQKEDAQRVAATLIVRARRLLETPDLKPSITEINAALNAYNTLIVRLGLTEPSQLAYFPRLQSIGLALAEIRTQYGQP